MDNLAHYRNHALTYYTAITAVYSYTLWGHKVASRREREQISAERGELLAFYAELRKERERRAVRTPFQIEIDDWPFVFVSVFALLFLVLFWRERRRHAQGIPMPATVAAPAAVAGPPALPAAVGGIALSPTPPPASSSPAALPLPPSPAQRAAPLADAPAPPAAEGGIALPSTPPPAPSSTAAPPLPPLPAHTAGPLADTPALPAAEGGIALPPTPPPAAYSPAALPLPPSPARTATPPASEPPSPRVALASPSTPGPAPALPTLAALPLSPSHAQTAPPHTSSPLLASPMALADTVPASGAADSPLADAVQVLHAQRIYAVRREAWVQRDAEWTPKPTPRVSPSPRSPQLPPVGPGDENMPPGGSSAPRKLALDRLRKFSGPVDVLRENPNQEGSAARVELDSGVGEAD